MVAAPPALLPTEDAVVGAARLTGRVPAFSAMVVTAPALTLPTAS